NVDFAALRRAVADRVFDQVAERLGKQLAMTEKRHRPAWPIEAKRSAALVRDRIVHFGKFGGELADVEPGELLAPGERFRTTDLEDGGENPDKRVGVAHDAAEKLFLLGRVGRLGGCMRRGAQPACGRAKVVRER